MWISYYCCIKPICMTSPEVYNLVLLSRFGALSSPADHWLPFSFIWEFYSQNLLRCPQGFSRVAFTLLSAPAGDQHGGPTGQWPGAAGRWGLQLPQGTELPQPARAWATSLPWSFLFAPFSSADVTSLLQLRVSFCSCVHAKAWFGPSFGGLPNVAVFYLPHQAVICKANKRASQHYLLSFQCHLLSVCIFQIQPTLPVITLELVRSLTESPSRVSRAIYTLPARRRALLFAEAKPPVVSSLEPRLSLFV